MRIFLSYRRDDTSGQAGRLYDALSQRLGERNVFQDVTAIDPGVDFGDAIFEALDDCDAVLVVIGPAWVSVTTPGGVRRLEQSDDYVRLELAAALARDVRVVPVLVGGAAMPSSGDLPDELRALADRQAVVLHDATWRQDVDGLVSRLRGQPPVAVSHRRRAIVAALAITVLTVAAMLWLFRRTNGETDDAGFRQCPSSAGTELALASEAPSAEVPRFGDAGPFSFEVEGANYRPVTSDTWLIILRTVMTNMESSDSANDHYRYDSLDVDGHPATVWCYTNINPADGGVGPGEKATALVGFEVTRDPHGHLQLRLDHEPATVNLDLTPQ